MTTPETAPAEWSFARRLGFRFVFSYFVLYFIPFPLDLIHVGKLWSLWAKAWEHLTIWTGTHVLHLANPIAYQPTGSGDTMHDYVLTLISLAIAVVATVLWSALDRRRRDYTKLAWWFRLYLRYALAAIMLSYGFSKVFDLQFSPPGISDLAESYGESSPMHLAWTFMGYSVAYTAFAGALECLGGLLLLFRRTATFGAVVTMAVMVNVVMMNFCFDIPVKLRSTHLLLTALVILAPSLARLMDVLLFHRGAEPEDVRPPAWAGWRRWSRWGLKGLVVAYLLNSNIAGDWARRKRETASGPGVAYEVEAVTRNGVEVPPLITDKTRWRYAVTFNGGSVFLVRAMDGSRASYMLKQERGAWELAEWWPEHKAPMTFHASTLDASHLLLDGVVDGAQTQIRLVKKDAKDFPLMNRGFHWISEKPYNH